MLWGGGRCRVSDCVVGGGRCRVSDCVVEWWSLQGE